VIDAVRVATERRAALLGPLVVISSELHLARWVRKSRTSGVHAFESTGFGPIGVVVEGDVHIWAAPLTEEFLGLPETLSATVEIVAPELGSDAHRLEPLLASADGLVVAAMGGGHVPPSYVPALMAAVERGTPVVLASRTSAGPVLESTYDGFGCERELIAAGLIPAGMLSPSKARLRLAVALSLGLEAGDVFPHDARASRRSR
jgi:L-asparaginase